MTRILLSLVVVLTWAGQVFAANIRSGEHADFSRLVIQFDATFDWEFGRTASGYMVRSRGLNSSIDTSRVFELIPRDRIAQVNLNQAQGELFIEVACDCHGDAFEIRAGRVVIDIKDGPPPQSSRFEQALAEPKQDDPSILERDLVTEGKSTPEPKRVATSLPASLIDTAEFKTELVAGLSRAMTQGLVSPGISLEEIAKASEEEMRQPLAESAPSIAPDTDADVSVGSNALTQVEVDRLQRFLADPVKQFSRCAKFRDLDLTLNKAEPLEIIQSERSRLYDPMGRLSQPVAFELTGAYLSLGFGAEALEILSVVEQTDPRTAPFRAIGAILEQQPITDTNPFWGQIECRGGYVIWEILSRDAPSRLDAEHLRGIQLHFLELPKQLRRRVGPELGVKLAEAGYLEVAQVIRNSLVRAETSDFAALRSLDASMALETDDPETAVRHLEEMVLENNSESPKALLRLFEAYAKFEINPAKKFRDLLSSYGFELQGTPLGQEISVKEFEVLISEGRLADAIGKISGFELEERRLKDSEVNRLARQALKTSSGITFARFVLDRRQALEAASIDPKLFEEIVARLISDNFLQVAQEVSGRSGVEDRATKERLNEMLSARRSSILLALGN